MKMIGRHAREVAERIVETFKHPEKLPIALAPIFIRRKDDVPCRKWSWHNQLLVALSGSIDARGIRQWDTVGRRLKKGCHAIWILAPCIKKSTQKDDDGNEEPTKHKQVLYGFRSIPVFAVEDTEGEALPETDDKYESWIQSLPLMEVAEDWGITVDTYTHESGNPLGYYRYARNGNQAVMLGVENLATWAHEMVHAADHRLTNLAGQKWHKEIVAELGGAILLDCLGQSNDADLGGAFSYIEGYAREEKLPIVKACIQVLDRTCNAVQLILDTAAQVQTPAPTNTPACSTPSPNSPSLA